MDKKQLKRIFNKNIFSDKSFIKMVCFTIVLLLVLVLGSNFGYVSADSIPSSYDFDLGLNSSCNFFANSEDYEDSSIYETLVYQPFAYTYNETYAPQGYDVQQFDYLKNYGITGFPSVDAYGTTIDYSNFDAYCFTSDKNLILYNSSHCKIFFGNNNYKRCWIYSDSDGQYFMTCTVSVGNPSTIVSNSAYYREVQSWTGGTVGFGSRYNVEVIGGNGISFSLGNAPVYSFLTEQSINGIISTLASLSETGSYSDVNYLIHDGAINPSAGSGLGGSTGGDASNNMYVEYADWYLNNYNGNIAGNFRNMSVSFTTNLNNYINEQLANETGTSPSDWVIYVDYSSFIDFYYKSVTDYGNVQLSISLPENFASVSYTTPDISSSTVYHWSANYEFPLYNNSDLGYNSAFDNVFHSPYNGYTTGFFMDGYKFANNANYVWTCPFSGLFAYMTPTSNSKFTDSNGVTYSITASLYEIMQMVDANMINWSPEYEGLNQFKLTCDAQIMYVGNDSSVDYTSGWYSETFNLLTGESVTGSNAMLTNYNPYIDNTTEDYSNNLPSTSTGTGSTSVTTGNVTQTVTVSNEGAKYIPSIISSLIPSSFGDTSTGLAQRFTTLVDSNNFITVMANTVPAIPTTVWTYLTEYLGISLYLLACAFVLRLILDLL